MDAQRQELFAAKFDGERTIHARDADCFAERMAGEHCKPGDRVTGPGLQAIGGGAAGRRVDVVDESMWQPMAAAVGQIGWREFRAGRRDDVWKLLPQYYRQSAAEEKSGDGSRDW